MALNKVTLIQNISVFLPWPNYLDQLLFLLHASYGLRINFFIPVKLSENNKHTQYFRLHEIFCSLMVSENCWTKKSHNYYCADWLILSLVITYYYWPNLVFMVMQLLPNLAVSLLWSFGRRLSKFRQVATHNIINRDSQPNSWNK